jgi:hypothetical protein
MKDTTVIYYTANREKEAFESKIREKLLTVIGDMPLISVSHKPIVGFGKNICVGDMPYCDLSALKQLYRGLKEATTTFAIVAESDCLYPPDYFSFTPPTTDNVYRYGNIWILHAWVGPRNQGKAWRKYYSEGAQMCGREFWIKKIEESWEKDQLVFNTKNQYSWTSENPMISFKTADGLRKDTKVIRSEEPKDELPYWGKVEDIKKEFFGVCNREGVNKKHYGK